MPGSEARQLEGRVVDVLPNSMFRIELTSGAKVLAHISGDARLNLIRILPGDRVKIELSPLDVTRGRIVDRLK